ncbi:hypothetical protein SMD44_07338 [Streptomyces alboflavus]|uniref:Uncharacterized protein n=1 Tax=Streptomyces alboflavus TaxID=67267 RepID=A0A1Z1WN40_9ACTN|nr:hypothetical protein [Streptomyces alboflavus]ARX87856.1 hypothetical protein SMD44_07338 [Streptomyces alboflavus]
MTAEMKVGDVVVDVPRDRVVKVRGIDGDLLIVSRPQGLKWKQKRQACRLATLPEQRGYEIVEAAQRKAASYTPSGSPREVTTK